MREYVGIPTIYLKIDEVEWKRGYDDGYMDRLKHQSVKDCSQEKFKAYRTGYSKGYEIASLDIAEQQKKWQKYS